MTKEELCGILDKVPTPIYQIEVELGMPKTTLQKAIKGERELPKKWTLKLLEAYPPKKAEIKIQDATEPTNVVKPEKPLGAKKSNITINTAAEPKERTGAFFLKYGVETWAEVKNNK